MLRSVFRWALTASLLTVLATNIAIATTNASESPELLLAINPIQQGDTTVNGSVGFNALPGDSGNVPPAQSGSLDEDYGVGGAADVPLDDSSGELVTMATDAFGRSLLAGVVSANDAAITRIGASGDVDTTFGDSGSVFLPDGFFPVDLATTPEGDILVAVVSPDGVFGLIQYRSDGVLDVGFGEGGSIGFDAVSSIGGSIDVDDQGQILIFNN